MHAALGSFGVLSNFALSSDDAHLVYLLTPQSWPQTSGIGQSLVVSNYEIWGSETVVLVPRRNDRIMMLRPLYVFPFCSGIRERVVFRWIEWIEDRGL